MSAGAALAAVVLGCSFVFNALAENVMEARKDFDRQNLFKLMTPDLFDNDMLVDTFLLRKDGEQTNVVNISLLGLQRDRFAYIAREGDEVIAVLVPATVPDGFNGFVDLLIAVTMEGRIVSARVIEDLDTPALYGVVEVIESHWMTNFSGNSMRDMRRLSWSTIEPVAGEYDQFVGASLTPKAVANKVYDALVFFQSNRIALMQGDSR